MAKKKTESLKTPTPLNPADKAALARILKKARAFKAFYKAQSPELLKVPSKRRAK